MQSRVFKPSVWLNFNHDGYPLVPFEQYLEVRNQHPTPNQDESAEMGVSNTAAQMQSLLTFGLIEGVVEKHVPECALTRKTSNGGTVITKDGLGHIIKDWARRICKNKDNYTPWLERAHTTLKRANSLLAGLVSLQFRCFEPLGDDAPSTVCLIAMIGEALANAKRAFKQSPPREGFAWGMVLTPHYHSLLEEDMLAQGWCPSVISYLTSTVSVSSLEYAVSCGPMNDGKDHQHCSPQSCATYVVDTTTYAAQHTSTCRSLLGRLRDTCYNISVDLREVEGLLLAGEIPVIKLDKDEDGHGYKLSVHKGRDVEYVAISHVWADGLGSTTEDGLPVCQIRRLTTLVGRQTAFWIDSLCIPRAESVRKKAIGMMAQTYSQAKAVLVLDRTLQLCQSTAPLGVRILRVLTSGWMQRLWTLQEAVLSKALYLNFADAQTPLNGLIPSTSVMLLSSHLTDLAGGLFRLTKKSAHGVYSVGDIARSLRWRTTNRPSDETLAIASLLGVQPSILVNIKSELRMIRLIQELGSIPSNVLFLKGSKLQVPGFRWLPSSFMAAQGASSGGSQLSTGSPDGRVTPRGLEATYYALKFPKTRIEEGKPWVLKDTKCDRLYEVVDPIHSVGSYECGMLLLPGWLFAANPSACVAVSILGHSSENDDGSFVVYTEYQRRLLIRKKPFLGEITAASGPSAISVAVSGSICVCVG
ncbi:uncharacterized protein F4812DRAFT_325956 [Daldinia caldariorum]|uniref:uncharacterized protein n=1 Tax=Daldinia caldariorum TaxID=326644 RepID=UPI0020084910|nr:uncharacterized protein F4812DRAFT_325956 [Daldinia caldariorum]KAI1469339.1 hypothetical protein F4812DRAFT_325956 [Daldinia caldariorum]